MQRYYPGSGEQIKILIWNENLPVFHAHLATNTYQGLFFQKWNASIKNEHRLYAIIQQFTNTSKEDNKVGIWDGVSMTISHTLAGLV